MPLDDHRCGTCFHRHEACPQCGSTTVTALDGPEKPRPQRVLKFGGKDSVTYVNACWDCGWREEVTMHVERE